MRRGGDHRGEPAGRQGVAAVSPAASTTTARSSSAARAPGRRPAGRRSPLRAGRLAQQSPMQRVADRVAGLRPARARPRRADGRSVWARGRRSTRRCSSASPCWWWPALRARPCRSAGHLAGHRAAGAARLSGPRPGAGGAGRACASSPSTRPARSLWQRPRNGIETDGVASEEVLARAAGLERQSEHRPGPSIVAAAAAAGDRAGRDRRRSRRARPRHSRQRRRRAVAAGNRRIDGGAGLVASRRARANVRRRWRRAGHSVVYVGWDGRVRAVLALEDTPRPEARSTIEALRGPGCM